MQPRGVRTAALGGAWGCPILQGVSAEMEEQLVVAFPPWSSHRNDQSPSLWWNQFCSSRNKKKDYDAVWNTKDKRTWCLKLKQKTRAKAKQPFDSRWTQHLLSSSRSLFRSNAVPSVTSSDPSAQNTSQIEAMPLECDHNWGDTSEFPSSHRAEGAASYLQPSWVKVPHSPLRF